MHHDEDKGWLDKNTEAFIGGFALNEADFYAIMQALKNPPKPTQFLVDLIRGNDKIEK
jgi:hypothetical protein